MYFTADFHIHSHYSRATSPNLTFPELYRSALYKGIHVVGTGDFTHSGWISEMEEYLIPAQEPCLYSLRSSFAKPIEDEVPSLCHHPVRFILSAEISSIYKKGNRTRKVHNIIFAPGIETAKKIHTELAKIGNLDSDGRPILGLDCRHLMEILLAISEEIYVIPAHIWTPWFSVLGANSGFDDIEECFEEFTKYIFALETGLSSDPAMNWLCSRLDRFALVSNSDAHSAGKLGREANLFNTQLSYMAIFNALRQNREEFLGTIEFYPEEGKYHLDGHRKCQMRMNPEETVKNQGLCPVCHKPVTVGVLHRVMQLADRQMGFKPPLPKPFYTLVGLETILAEVLGTGPDSKKVQASYHQLLNQGGCELDILQKMPIDSIERISSPVVVQAIHRVRSGQLKIAAGYDGEFGTIHIFGEGEKERLSAHKGICFVQDDLFASVEADDLFANVEAEKSDDLFASAEAEKNDRNAKMAEVKAAHTARISSGTQQTVLDAYNPEQEQAIAHRATPLLIVAGPGTGKTRTLTARIAHLARENFIPCDKILAITFTNKAAQEMEERLGDLMGELAHMLTICTFHRLGLKILRKWGHYLGLKEDFAIYHPTDVLEMVEDKDLCAKSLDKIAYLKATMKSLQDEPKELQNACEQYQSALQRCHGLDMDDLIYLAAQLLQQHEDVRVFYQQQFQAIAVDEYQDVNYAQYRLLQLLLTEHTDLCVIGDPDQEIYGFRGADVGHFLNFVRDFPNARQICLQRNYRSSATIIKVASHVIAHNPSHIHGELLASFPEGSKVRMYQAPSEKAEAEFVVHTIEQLIGGISHFSLDSGRSSPDNGNGQYGFGSFAILYRMNSQSRALEEALSRSGMPYQVAGGISFWDTSPMNLWKTILSIAYDPHRNLDMLRLAGQFPGIGECSILRLKNLMRTEDQSLWQILEDVSNFSFSVRKALEAMVCHIQKWCCEKREDMCEFLNFLECNLPSPAWQLPQESRVVLHNIASSCKNLEELLTRISLYGQSDDLDVHAEKISLSTLHAAKGLEFPIVFITGCEQGILPYSHCENDRALSNEEERRLFYVGITRAREILYLVQSEKRTVMGKQCRTIESPYLQEIPACLTERVKTKWRACRDCSPSQGQQMEFF